MSVSSCRWKDARLAQSGQQAWASWNLARGGRKPKGQPWGTPRTPAASTRGSHGAVSGTCGWQWCIGGDDASPACMGGLEALCHGGCQPSRAPLGADQVLGLGSPLTVGLGGDLPRSAVGPGGSRRGQGRVQPHAWILAGGACHAARLPVPRAGAPVLQPLRRIEP